MEENQLDAAINHLINRVNSIPAISAEGLKNAPFPDEVIASMHNQLGNCKHYINDVDSPFNATEQFISITEAQKSVLQASEDLFKLHSGSVLPDTEYEAISEMMREVDEQLRKLTDIEYT